MGQIVGTVAAIAERFTDEAAMNEAYDVQRDSLRAQRTALAKDYDLTRVTNLVNDYDKGYLQRRRELQKQYEPELYAAGQAARQQLLQEAQTPTSSLESTRVAKKLFEENINQDPKLAKLQQAVIDRANKVLELGGALPPEYQAELIRAGVGQAAQAGITPGARSVGGTISNVLGRAGVQLEQARSEEASKLAGTAQSLQESRAKILGSIFPTIAQSEQSNVSRGAGLLGVSEQAIPQGTGVTGREALNLDLQGRQAQREINQNLKNLRAWRAIEFARIRDSALNTSAANWGGSAPGAYSGQSVSSSSSGGGGSSMSGISSMFSDKNAKTNFEDVNESEILDKVSKLPVSHWEYKPEHEDQPKGKHTGPMAQDWDKFFGSGKGDATSIPVVDAVGVALTSIKAIVKELKSLKAARA